MRTLLVSYDLGVPETSEDYKKLIEFIKTFPNWAKSLYAVWLVKTSKTCARRSGTKSTRKFDTNDKTIVIEITGAKWATWNIAKDVTTWMRQNM